MSAKIANHNMRVRVLLFFARPLHIFNIVLFFQMWKFMSYGPSTFRGYYNGNAAQVTEWLWSEQFSGYIWYFIIAAIADMVVQEYLPLISNK